MDIKIENSKGWVELLIHENCGFEKFYEVAKILESLFAIQVTERLHDFDSMYWDFEFHSSNLTLHYNVFFGVSIFPMTLNAATKLDNQKILEIKDQLSELLDSK